MLVPEPLPPQGRTRSLIISWIALGILLLFEILYLTFRHDAADVARHADRSSRLIATAPDVLRVAISMALATLALVTWRLRHRFRHEVSALGLASGVWPWLPLHLIAFAILDGSSRRVFGSTVPANATDVLIWFGSAACTGLFWLATAVAPRFWPVILRTGRGVLLAGIAFGLAGWWVGHVARSGWQSSAAPTFWAAGHLLGLIYPVVISDPQSFVLGTPTFQVTIAPACSGYEGAGLVCLYLGLYLFIFRRDLRFPHALCLLPLGAVAAWILNVVRIAALIAIGDSVSPELALGGFHSQAGWLAFNAVALGLAFVAHRSRWFAPPTTIISAGPDPTAAYLLPLLSVVTVQMLTEAFFNGSQALYPLRVVVGAMVLGYCWRSIESLGNHSTPTGTETSWRGTLWPVLTGVAVFGIWVGLWAFAPPAGPTSDPRADLAGMPVWVVAVWLVFRVVGSVVLLPIVEEVVFRGYVIRRLIAADFQTVSPRRFTWASFLISSVLFGVLHEHWLAGILAGMAYATVLNRRGRLSDAILAHATTNGLISIVALITGNWRFWS